MKNKIINNYKESFLKDLFDIISYDTVLVEQPEVKDAPFGCKMVEALNYTLELGKKMGFKTKNVENVCGYIEFGEGKEMIGILCHLDVVPTGSGWTSDPFKAVIRDGNIYARGVNDDKGPLMASLYAMKILKDSGFKPNKRIRLIFGTDEESGSRGLLRYIELEETPTFAFSPDAEFPIIYGEKGIASVDIESNEECVGIKSIKSGDRYNIVPEEAIACLDVDLESQFKDYLKKYGYFGEVKGNQYIMRGKRAHAMEPRNGENALIRLCLFLRDHFNCGLVNYVCSFLQDSRMGDIALNYTDKEMGDLTMNVAVCDFSKGGKVGLNFRYPIGVSMNHIVEIMQEKTHDYHLNIRLLSDSEPHYVSPKGEYIQKLHKAYIDVTGDDKTPLLTIGGGTYARHFKNAVAFGAGLPGREEVAHNVDEYMSVDDLLTSIDIYMEAIKNLG